VPRLFPRLGHVVRRQLADPPAGAEVDTGIADERGTPLYSPVGISLRQTCEDRCCRLLISASVREFARPGMPAVWLGLVLEAAH
jgi:hypothetical protein